MRDGAMKALEAITGSSITRSPMSKAVRTRKHQSPILEMTAPAEENIVEVEDEDESQSFVTAGNTKGSDDQEDDVINSTNTED